MTEAERALTFAREHDWGATAYLDDNGKIDGLMLFWKDEEGRLWWSRPDPIDATMQAVRTFAH